MLTTMLSYADRGAEIYGVGNIEHIGNDSKSSIRESMSRLASAIPLSKLNDIVENYFYKYVDDANDKLDVATEHISHRLDTYLSYI